LRCGIESLSARVAAVLLEQATSSQIFVFTNKRRDRIRLHCWDGTGLWLMTKRLEKGTFAWPKIEPGIVKVTLRPDALEMLLAGIDLKGAALRPWWEQRPQSRMLGGNTSFILTSIDAHANQRAYKRCA
jgi:transposase